MSYYKSWGQLYKSRRARAIPDGYFLSDDPVAATTSGAAAIPPGWDATGCPAGQAKPVINCVIAPCPVQTCQVPVVTPTTTDTTSNTTSAPTLPTIGAPATPPPTSCPAGYSMNWNSTACVTTPGVNKLDPSICSPGQVLQNDKCISTTDPSYVPPVAATTTITPDVAAAIATPITDPTVGTTSANTALQQLQMLQMMQQLQAQAQTQQVQAQAAAAAVAPSYAPPAPKPQVRRRPMPVRRPARGMQIMGMDAKTVGLIVAGTAALVLLLKK